MSVCKRIVKNPNYFLVARLIGFRERYDLRFQYFIRRD